MQIGFVKKREIALRGEEGEAKRVSYYEMTLKPLFGASVKFTLNKNKSDKENAPLYNIYAHNERGWVSRKMKVGALWLKETDEGESFMSGMIETPLVDGGKLYISLWRAEAMYKGEVVDWEYDVVWKPYTPPKDEDQTQRTVPVEIVTPSINIDEDEIPF